MRNLLSKGKMPSSASRGFWRPALVMAAVAWAVTAQDITYNSDQTEAYFTLANGTCTEKITTEKPCHSWIMLHGTSMYNKGVLAFFYGLFLIFLFLGIAIVADIFMGAIEVITRYLGPLTAVKKSSRSSAPMTASPKWSRSRSGTRPSPT